VRLSTEDETWNIVVIYAPNDTTERKRNFYKKIESKLRNVEREGLIMLGDHNICEELMDRSPISKEADDSEVLDTLRNIKQEKRLEDGWRMSNPEAMKYTFRQTNKNGEIASRIDRIYTNEKLTQRLEDWKNHGPVQSDHDLISVVIKSEVSTKMGSPRWRIQESTLKEPMFRKEFLIATKRLQEELTNQRERAKRQRIALRNQGKSDNEIKSMLKEERQNRNPQTAWQDYKTAIKVAGMLAAEIRIKNFNKETNNLENKLHILEEDLQREDNDDAKTRKEIRIIKEAQAKLLDRKVTAIRMMRKTNWRQMGETNSKYYYETLKQKQGREPIRELRKEDESITRNAREMANVAGRYHERLQAKPEMNQEREEAIRKTLNTVQKEINQDTKEELAKMVKSENLRAALKKCKGGKSPGEDGLTYEFWKWAIRTTNEHNEEKATNLDVMDMMSKYLKDIEKHGPIDNNFAKGIMVPSYKKGDRTLISNYRPLTMLNTDYKLYTRTVAHKLIEVCNEIIHENQAGFIPGRSIYDHTRLINMIEETCEREETNGYILALDQEKAYDKIDHSYLWRTLEKYNFPEKLISNIRRIYESAETSVMVNNYPSNNYKVERGCRQGDPMSCLIYDIAIEPLGNLLRQSKLEGIKLFDEVERALVLMFADDTAIVMNENDDIKEVNRCTELFCKASTAKFNDKKEEILAVGTEQFRENFITTRTMATGTRLPDYVKIVTNQEPMRMLGAYHGNMGRADEQWKKILAKQQEIMNRAQKSHPTTKGKVMILKALIESRALYLAMVNGMPQDIEEKMEKQMRNFLWEGKKGLINWELATQPRDRGGLGAPSVRARKEAIETMWLKRLCAKEVEQPLWSKIANKMLTKHSENKNTSGIIDWTTQMVEEHIEKLPKSLQRIVKIARKVNLGISPALPSAKLKELMPAAHHISIKRTKYRHTADCIFKAHRVKTLSELKGLSEKTLKQIREDLRRDEEKCERGGRKCAKKAEQILKELPEKWRIETEEEIHPLDHTPRRLKANAKLDYRKERIAFNPTIVSSDSPREELRIFRIGKAQKIQAWKIREGKEVQGSLVGVPPPETPRKNKATKRRRIEGNDEDVITIYTDGSAIRNGAENAEAGAGLWYGRDHPRNKAVKLEMVNPTNNKAELVAVLIALQDNPDTPIEIRTDSEMVVKGLLYRAKKWEDKNWLEIKDTELWKAIIAELRKRPQITYIKWVKGHAKDEGNKEADKLANEGRSSAITISEEDIQHDKTMMEDGAKLSTLTMKEAYKMIMEARGEKIAMTEPREHRLTKCADDIELMFKYRPKKEDILGNIKKLSLENKVKDFVWKVQLNLHKCGEYFEKMEGEWKNKAYCKCGAIENIEHILFECDENENTQVWEQIKTWIGKKPTLTMNMSTLMGIGTLDAAARDNDSESYDNKALKREITLLAYGAWAIWKARCKRVIDDPEADTQKARMQLREDIKRLVEIDYRILKRKKNKKGIENHKKIWEKIIEIKDNQGSPIRCRYTIGN
jgi:ribonuclease HI